MLPTPWILSVGGYRLSGDTSLTWQTCLSETVLRVDQRTVTARSTPVFPLTFSEEVNHLNSLRRKGEEEASASRSHPASR